jgi:hypothetical protein
LERAGVKGKLERVSARLVTDGLERVSTRVQIGARERERVRRQVPIGG